MPFSGFRTVNWRVGRTPGEMMLPQVFELILLKVIIWENFNKEMILNDFFNTMKFPELVEEA
jgi:hypothetical protein